MTRAIAIIVTDLDQTRLGLPSRVGHNLAGCSVLEHTVGRIARVRSIAAIVVVHPVGQDPRTLVSRYEGRPPLCFCANPDRLLDSYQPMRRAARKWSLSAWRGGLAGATCYDELLPAAPLVMAMDQQQADAALLVGADWLLVDPMYCQQVLDQHLANPEAMAFTFTQAPPGLAGVAIARSLLSELAEKNGLIGQFLSYNPMAAQADPIGRDVCIQIDGEVRSCNRRFICDTPHSAALIDALANALGGQLPDADAKAIANAVREIDSESDGTNGNGHIGLNRQVTLELTPQRLATGPVVAQHHIRFDRDPIDLDLAVSIVEQLGAEGDTVLTLGGLGDALLHEHWLAVVRAAHRANVLGIAIHTDLIVDQSTLAQLIEAPIDVVCVRLNADTSRRYHQLMGVDQFALVMENMRALLNHRFQGIGDTAMEQTDGPASGESSGRLGLPWVVPHLIKTRENMADMETFFDRWLHFAQSAVIEPAATGVGLIPDQSPMSMAPPKRFGCRQIEHRMTIHSDGTVAQCDQDWLGRASVGDAKTEALSEIWRVMHQRQWAHRQGQWNDLALCKDCVEWHRP